MWNSNYHHEPNELKINSYYFARRLAPGNKSLRLFENTTCQFCEVMNGASKLINSFISKFKWMNLFFFFFYHKVGVVLAPPVDTYPNHMNLYFSVFFRMNVQSLSQLPTLYNPSGGEKSRIDTRPPCIRDGKTPELSGACSHNQPDLDRVCFPRWLLLG